MQRTVPSALFCLVLVALVAPSVLGAQVNIERLRRTNAGPGLSGSAGANVTARAGNVRLMLVAVNGRLDYARRRWLAFVVGNTDVGWQGGERFSNAGLLHVRYNYRATPALAAEVFGQVNYDKARLLAFRSLAGIGSRVAIRDTGAWRLTVGTAGMLEHERLDPASGAPGPAVTTAWRWSSYASASYGAGGRLATVLTVYAQPRFDDFNDARVTGDARLVVQIAGPVSLAVSSHLRYDSRPPQGIEAVDAAFTTGATVEW